MDLNLFNEFGFTKDVSLLEQYCKVIEESKEVEKEFFKAFHFLRHDKEKSEETLNKLEKELLDSMLSTYNLYKIVGKTGNKRDSFMEWYQNMLGYKEGKYKDLVEE